MLEATIHRIICRSPLVTGSETRILLELLDAAGQERQERRQRESKTLKIKASTRSDSSIISYHSFDSA
jgi:hypothetical protein